LSTDEQLKALEQMKATVRRRDACALARVRAEARQRRINKLVCRSAIPPRYQTASLEQPASEQAHAYGIARQFVEQFPDHCRTGAGLIFWGDIGTGKTHLGCAVANVLISQMRSVMYCTALETILLIKAAWHRNTGGSEYETYERFTIPELLIIDELGIQHGSAFEQMVMTAIIDARCRQCLPTIGITNLTPEALCGMIGERAFDRLVGFGGQIVHMVGASKRVDRSNDYAK
jgi:DNA replication protein DnaC